MLCRSLSCSAAALSLSQLCSALLLLLLDLSPTQARTTRSIGCDMKNVSNSRCFFPISPSPLLSHGMQLTDATRTYILYKVYIKLQQLVKLSVANEKSFSSLFPFLFQLSTARCLCSPSLTLPLSLSLSCLLWSLKLLVKLNWSTRIESNRIDSFSASSVAQLNSLRAVAFYRFFRCTWANKSFTQKGVEGEEGEGREAGK